MFEVFDLPDQNVTCPKRYVSTVPTQALTLLNNEFVVKHAGLLAQRIHREAGENATAQIERGYEIALARKPADEERRLALEFLERETKSAGADAALAGLAHVLLNLNEFVYIR